MCVHQCKQPTSTDPTLSLRLSSNDQPQPNRHHSSIAHNKLSEIEQGPLFEAMGTRSGQSTSATTHHRTRSRMEEVVQAAASNSQQQNNSSPTRGKKRKVQSHPKSSFRYGRLNSRTVILLLRKPLHLMKRNHYYLLINSVMKTS